MDVTSVVGEISEVYDVSIPAHSEYIFAFCLHTFLCARSSFIQNAI